MKLKINRTWMILGIAVIFGVGAALGAMRYLSQRVSDIEARDKNKAMTKVVVAKENLQKGAKLTSANVAVREIPAEWSHSGAITPDQFDRADNALLAHPAARGEPVIWAQLEGQRAPSFSARLAPGRRAITVPVDEISSLSGMVQPGDLIDLLVSVRKDNLNYTFALLQSVNVLATGTRATQESDSEEGKARTFTTITLDTTPEDAKRVVAAREIGKLTAMLRAPGDRDPVSRERSEAMTLVGLGRGAAGESAVPVIYGGVGAKLDQVASLNGRPNALTLPPRVSVPAGSDR
jgi:pilus assembly protein CpaB